MSDQSTPEPPDDDYPALFELALRLLEPEDPSPSGNNGPRLFVGRLPEGLTVDIPVPPGARVVGSMESEEFDVDQIVEVVLDIPEPAEHFLEAYKELAANSGWSESGDTSPGGGFSFSPVEERLLLCRGERGPALFVAVNKPYSGDERPADVRLRLTTGERYSPCTPEPYDDDFERHIPRLSPPPGTRQFPGGGGGGPDDAHSDATLEADLEVSAVGEHYAGELAAAGWSRTGGGHSGPQAWSAWKFTDERNRTWKGLFTALKLPDSRQYFLQVHVHWSREPEGA